MGRTKISSTFTKKQKLYKSAKGTVLGSTQLQETQTKEPYTFSIEDRPPEGFLLP